MLKKLVKASLPTLVCLAIALIIVEATAHRLFQGRWSLAPITAKPSVMQPHDKLGWVPRPNVSTYTNQIDFGARIQTNSKGLFDLEHDYEKPEGVFRIVFLGDSFLAGGYVEPEELLPARLQVGLSKYARVEVINLGVISYSTIQEYIYLREEGLKYHPDLVLHAFFAQNDIRNNYQPLEERAWPPNHAMAVGRPYVEAYGSGTFTTEIPNISTVGKNIDANVLAARNVHLRFNPIYRSFTWQLGLQLLARSREDAAYSQSGTQLTVGAFTTKFQPDAFTGGWTSEEWKQHWEEAWKITERTLGETHRAAIDSGADYAIVLFPSKVETDSRTQDGLAQVLPGAEFDFRCAAERIQQFARSNEVRCLDLYDAFHTNPGNQVLFNRLFDQHWTAEGHALASETLTELLEQEGMIGDSK